MAFLDWLKSYMPEEQVRTEMSGNIPQGPQPTPSVPPEALSFLAPKTPSAPELFGGPARSEPFNYGDTFLRTPVNETNAKAAEVIRKIAFPQEQQELESPAPMTPMRKVSPQEESLTKLLSATAVPKERAPAKEVSKVEVKPTDEQEEALMEPVNNNDELRDAQRVRSEQLKLAGILEAMNTIGTSVATRGAQTAQELSPDAFKSMKEMAHLKVGEVKERREADQADIKAKLDSMSLVKMEGEQHSEAQKRDPNSDISILYRETLKEAFPNLKVDGMSAANLEKIMPTLMENARVKDITESRKETARINAELRHERTIERKDKTSYEQQERYQKDLSKLDQKNNEATKYMDEAYSQAELALENPQAAQNLARSVIKAIEGAGARVSDKDFGTAVGDASVGGKIADTVNKLSTGTIRNVTSQDIRLMLDASKKIQERKHKEMTKSVVERYSKRSGLPLTEAADIGVIPHDVLKEASEFPKQVVNKKTGQAATVSNEQELKEAQKEGFQ